jgi:hypothetical protein
MTCSFTPACLLSGVIVHGSVPDDLLIGTTIPIPKSKHSNVTSSDNYRGITLSNIMGQILDNIIMTRYSTSLVSSDLQFGFKRKTLDCDLQYGRQGGNFALH